MKYVIFENKTNKFLNVYNQMPATNSTKWGVAICEIIPPLNKSNGEYYEVHNIQEHIETYTEKIPVEVKKIDEFGQEYASAEWVDIEKNKTYLTCELRVADKPNKAQLIEEKQAKYYENKIVALIRKKYSLNAELAILRQRDTKPEEYAEYFDYVEECKNIVKSKN